jgi:hypothetical protein
VGQTIGLSRLPGTPMTLHGATTVGYEIKQAVGGSTWPKPLFRGGDQLELALRLEYWAEPQLRPVFEECTVLGKQVYRLRDALMKRV